MTDDPREADSIGIEPCPVCEHLHVYLYSNGEDEAFAMVTITSEVAALLLEAIRRHAAGQHGDVHPPSRH